MKEEWKRLIYNGEDYGDYYLVSNLGKIKSIKTNNIMHNYTNKKNPYAKVNLSFGSSRPQKSIRVHRAVACTFIPNPNNLPQINHKDGNKLNNNINNLEWVTAKQNSIHAVINDLYKSGEESSLSKLNREQIGYIKKNCIPFDSEFGCKALAEKFNVDRSTISKILHDASWKEYSGDYELIPNIINDLHKTKIYNRKCIICGTNFNTINEDQKYCSQECSHIPQRRSERPSKEELFKLIKGTPFVQIGKMFGVSDNAIRKWCKSYNLPYRKKDIKQYSLN